MKSYIKYLNGLSLVLLIIGILLIHNHQVKFSSAKITNPLGMVKKARFPFVLNNGVAGTYTYETDLKASALFSGEIQIIPTGCVTKILVNGIKVPEFFYLTDSCDFSNGFYLDISSYLQNTDNKITIETKSAGNKYGLNIRDTTRYEIYYILWIVICFLSLIIIKYYKKINLALIRQPIIKNKKNVLLVLFFAGLLLFTIQTLIVFKSQVELVKPDGTSVQLGLPFLNNHNDSLVSKYKLTLYNYNFFPFPNNIFIEDSIQAFVINGVDGSSALKSDKDYRKENFNSMLSKVLKTGKNEILIIVDNHENFTIIKNNYFIIFYFIFLMLMLSPLIYKIYNKFFLGKYIAPLFAFSILVWLMYACTLPYNAISHDIKGHIQYIKFIYEKCHIPISGGGWSFYHPPLYFISSAISWHLANIFGINSELMLKEMLQIFSVLLFIIYSYFSIKSLDFIIKINFEKIKGSINPKLLSFLYLPIVCLFLFWPSNIIHSIRIGNDIMLYAFYAISFFFILKWYFLKDLKNLIISLIFASLAIWSKTNAMLLFGIIGLLLIYQVINDENRRSNRHSHLFRFYFLIGFAVFSLYFAFNEKIKDIGSNMNSKMLVENENDIPLKYNVGNHLSNFLSFDVAKFADMTFTNTVDDAKGRQSFWYYLLKTSLFGEFSFNRPTSLSFAILVNFLFLLLLPIILAGIILSFFDFKIHAPFILNVLILFGSMIVFRIMSPHVSANDFRFIFPAILCFAYFTGLTGIYLLKKNKVLFFVVWLVPIFFVLCSIIFQVSYIF